MKPPAPPPTKTYTAGNRSMDDEENYFSSIQFF